MIEMSTFISQIQQDIPDMGVTSDPLVLQKYAIDGLAPRLIFTPENAEDMGRAIALINEHGLTTLAQGGGSRMHLGSVPEPRWATRCTPLKAAFETPIPSNHEKQENNLPSRGPHRG